MTQLENLMCEIVYVGDLELDTVDQVAHQLDIDLEPFLNKSYKKLDGEACLCQIDVKRMFEELQLPAEYTGIEYKCKKEDVIAWRTYNRYTRALEKTASLDWTDKNIEDYDKDRRCLSRYYEDKEPDISFYEQKEKARRKLFMCIFFEETMKHEVLL